MIKKKVGLPIFIFYTPEVLHMKTLYLVGQDAPITRLPSTFPKIIDESIALGLDVGIGSCGQALVSLNANADRPPGKLPFFFDAQSPSPIRFMGVRAFNVPEEKETTGVKLKNPERRAARLLRRSIRRRAHRMIRARGLLKREGILPPEYHIDAPEWRKKHEAATPWQWRLQGLSRKLEPWEWAVALLHIARHRGFRSNKKSDIDSKGAEGGTLQSSRTNHAALEKYQSVADMMLNDDRFSDRIRNQPGDYKAMVLRADLEAEIQKLFACQREFGNPNACIELETKFLEIFNKQNSIQHPYALLESCPFEADEKRGPRLSYSFELSRALQKLNTLTLLLPDHRKVTLKEHICAEAGGFTPFIEAFGQRKSISWNDLRDIFAIKEEIRFVDLPIVAKGKETVVRPEIIETFRKDAEKTDFVTRSNSKPCAEGTALLRSVLGAELWQELLAKGDILSIDNAAFCLTFFESPEAILEVLRGDRREEHLKDAKGRVPRNLPAYSADKRVIEAIQADFTSESPRLVRFNGSTSLSTKASRALIPYLAKGLVYSEACACAGYQHARSDFALKSIVNPVVSSVIREVMKQVVHLIHESGVIPGSICIELGRDLGKSIDERNETTRGLQKRTNERNDHRKQVAETLGVTTEKVSADALLRYELWQEQSGLCPYCGEPLPEIRRALNEQLTQVDHVLPRSRSHDNSHHNRVLVHIACNQEKGNQTPAEWLGAAENSERWKRLVATAQRMPRMKNFKKKRYLLNETFQMDGEAEKFISRNLNDTRYIARVLAEYLKDIYRIAGETPDEKGSQRRIFVQPGSLTALVRKAWGLEGLKKDLDGDRIDDRHHAVDALICACLSEGQRQRLTKKQQTRASGQASTAFRNTLEHLSSAYQAMEMRHENRTIPLRVSPPWPDLRSDVIKALERLNVSRRENRKGTGHFHQDTFYGALAAENGQLLYHNRQNLIQQEKGKKTALLKTLNDLEKVKGIHDPKNEWLKEALTDWITRGSPLDEASLPRNPSGAIIRKVTQIIGSRAGRSTPHGYVVNGKMIRVDVYSRTKPSKSSKKQGEPAQKNYYLVPVYTYDIRHDEPPKRAIVANKPESEWDIIDESYTFEFSLWQNSPFEVRKKPTTAKPEGEYIIAYYRGLDRGTGKITARALNSANEEVFCSVKQGCISFRKLNIDRLGNITFVKREKRTWRGKAYT